MKKAEMVEFINERLTNGSLKGLYVDRLEKIDPPEDLGKAGETSWKNAIKTAKKQCQKIDDWNKSFKK